MKPLTMVTCYDFSFARILAGVPGLDYILVGDSAANVIYGEERTTGIDLARMLLHVQAVRRGLDRAGHPASEKKPTLIGDFPAGSYDTPEMALETAAKMKASGAEILKLEGPVIASIEALRKSGYRVCGHIGYTPQSISEARVQGRDEANAKRILDEARLLDAAGVELLVLELMPRELAKVITAELKTPTIGIGAGPDCSGQVLVLYDLLGLDANFNPKFLQKFADANSFVASAVSSYVEAVQNKSFPKPEHSFS